MLNLLLSPPTDGSYKGLRLNTDFRAALEFIDIQNYYAIMRDSLGDMDAGAALAKEAARIFWNGNPPDVPDLFERLMDFIQLERAPGEQSEDTGLFDFYSDSGRIFASFFQAYGLDLADRETRLHWWKFNTLLEALPEESALMRVIELRDREPGEHDDPKYRRKLNRAKAAVVIRNHWLDEMGEYIN